MHGEDAVGAKGAHNDGRLPNAPEAASAVGRGGAARRAIAVLIAAAVVAGVFFGYRYALDQATYVSTNNAIVTGALIQVGSLNAGQVGTVVVDAGDRVAKGQIVATVVIPGPIGATSAGAPKMGFPGGDDQAPVRSPIDGVVVARHGNPGDTIGIGQALLTVVDPSQLWIKAQIEETKIGRVKQGTAVEVTIDALGKQVSGRVVAIDRATASTFSLIPAGNASGNYTRVTQLVPVKIAIDYGELPLVVGSSAAVKIRVQD